MKIRIYAALMALCLSMLLADPAAAQWDAADKGDEAYERGDYEGAFFWYSQAAEQGYLPAQLNLGIMYDEGIGVEENDSEAAKWFRLAAEQGDTQAQHNLGNMYAHGEGVTRNVAEALKWYRLAAEQGYDPSQLNLGVMYAEGDGVSKNYVAAYMWISLSAAQGNELAVTNKDVVKNWMTPAQLAKSEKMIADWKPVGER